MDAYHKEEVIGGRQLVGLVLERLEHFDLRGAADVGAEQCAVT